MAAAPDRSTSKPRSVASRPSPAKDFRLFVGIDVKAFWGGDFATVTDYVNDRARLDSPNQPALPVNRLERVRFQHATKLSRNVIAIGDVKTEFAYGAEQDLGDWMRQQISVQTATQDQTDLIVDNLGKASNVLSESRLSGDRTSFVANSPMTAQVKKFNNLQDQNNALERSGKTQEEAAGLNRGNHDALIVTAEVSSPVPVADAYLVVLAQIRTEEKISQDVIFFRYIGTLGPKSKPLRIRKDNMPPGFELLDLDLHIYREGQEIANELSEKQFALTREEALEYLTLERISSNRGKTLPAEPAWSLAPAELLASEQPNEFDFPLTVHVDAKGHVTRVDESTIVPGQISQIVGDLMFFPATENGAAIASVAQINLRDFFR
jgi:hypothetical protein